MNHNLPIIQQIENKFREIGFTWEQAETWAGFCHAVGMDPVPFLRVILSEICGVKSQSTSGQTRSYPGFPELCIELKGCKTCFKVDESS